MADTLRIRHGWVWAFALFIFFFNTFLLPEGLTYTLLLTPVWMYMLHLQGRLNIVLWILMPLCIYAVIHLLLGVDVIHYFRSVLMIGGIVTFLVFCYSCINSSAINWDLIFKDIAILNVLFTIASLGLLFFPSINDIVWYKVPVSAHIEISRLKLFTEEASHYSYLLAPIVIYFYSRALFFKSTNILLTLFIVTLPLVLSFSFGVLSCIALSFMIMVAVYFSRIFSTSNRELWLWLTLFSLFGVVVLMYKFTPNNMIFVRLRDIFSGDDTSARGRTYEAFILAHKVIAQKSYLWGIGPGQLKLIGRDIIVQYYYYSKIPPVIRIPNACAETIVYFGYVGFAIRIIVEVVLFYTTRVYSNVYRLWLFAFAFIYQFTGSYITNVAEYLVWILAFSSIFPEYEKLWLSPDKTTES